MSWLDDFIARNTPLSGSLGGTLATAKVFQLDGAPNETLPCKFNVLEWDPASSPSVHPVVSVNEELTTSTTSPTVIYTFPMPDNCTSRVRAAVVGRKPIGGDSYSADILGTYKRNSSPPLIVGTAPTPQNVQNDGSMATCSVDLVAIGNDLALVVTGLAEDIEWSAYFTAQSRL